MLRTVDLSRLAIVERENLLALRIDLSNARTYISDYELSETRDEQLANAKRSKQWLTRTRKKILKASEYNVFGPADVAQLSAQIDQLREELR